jgi:predicted RNase H-like HicB family nuclease
MSHYFPVVFEHEANGAVSAFVPGLPIYAAADTRRQAEKAIRQTIEAYLEAHPETKPTADVGAVRVESLSNSRQVSMVGLAALLGSRRSSAKRRAARRNGKLGGRPRQKGANARPAGRR